MGRDFCDRGEVSGKRGAGSWDEGREVGIERMGSGDRVSPVHHHINDQDHIVDEQFTCSLYIIVIK